MVGKCDEDGDALTRLFQLDVGHTLTSDDVRDIEAVVEAWQTANEQRLLKAARLVVAMKFDHYRSGNGRMRSIEGDDGEKCWIVPFDPMTLLESAVKELADRPSSNQTTDGCGE